jgi:hypothetical protein
MLESEVGLMIPDTRQNAGKFAMGGPAGGENEPAGTACATWIVTSGSAILASPSQSIDATAT